MKMKISILADDRTLDPGRFRTGHGLAALLQAAGRRILLDTGGSDVFEANAERLAIDLTNVDYVFLSHGHADHTGGLPAFLQINEQAKVIVSSEAVNGNFYSRKGALHSITAKKWPLEMMEGRTLFIEETQWFPEGFGVIAAIPQNHPLPKGDRDLLVMKDGSLFPDTFGHEMALYADGLLFTGCAHSGLENILEACP